MLKYITIVSCLILEYCVRINGQSSVGSNSGIADIMRDLASLRNLLLKANQNIYTLQSQLSEANQNIHTLQGQLVVANKDISSLKQETSQCKTVIDELIQNHTHLRFELKSEIDGIHWNLTALQTDQIGLLHDVEDMRKLTRQTDVKFALVSKARHESESKIKNNSITITNLQQKFVRYVNSVNFMNITINSSSVNKNNSHTTSQPCPPPSLVYNYPVRKSSFYTFLRSANKVGILFCCCIVYSFILISFFPFSLSAFSDFSAIFYQIFLTFSQMVDNNL